MESVKVSGLRKVYNEKGMPVDALRGVDLPVEKGEFLALVGPIGIRKDHPLKPHRRPGQTYGRGDLYRGERDHRTLRQ